MENNENGANDDTDAEKDKVVEPVNTKDNGDATFGRSNGSTEVSARQEPHRSLKSPQRLGKSLRLHMSPSCATLVERSEEAFEFVKDFIFRAQLTNHMARDKLPCRRLAQVRKSCEAYTASGSKFCQSISRSLRCSSTWC